MSLTCTLGPSAPVGGRSYWVSGIVLYTAYLGSIRNEVDYFVNRCVRKREQPLSTLNDARTAQKMIESIEASVEQGRAVELGEELR